MRQPGLPRAHYEITEWSQGSAFTWVARSLGVRTTATHTVIPRNSGSDLSLTVDWNGPLAPLVRRIARGKAQRFIETEATTLAGVAERA